MSELEDAPAEYQQDISDDEYLELMLDSKADFLHWSRMPFWTLDEGIALLLGRDPELANWGIVRDYVNYPISFKASKFCLEYSNLRALVLRAKKVEEIGASNSPATFLAWAQGKFLEVPDVLREMVANINSHFKEPGPEIAAVAAELRQGSLELDNPLALKEKEIQALKEKISFLENRVVELEGLRWEGFDEQKNTYSHELAIAVQAHNAVSKTFKKSSSIKKQLYLWLEENDKTLSNEARDRIATICNWQKSGGAPFTPS